MKNILSHFQNILISDCETSPPSPSYKEQNCLTTFLFLVTLTCRELQASVDGQAGSFALPDVHGELQAPRVHEQAIGEGELHFISAPADGFGGVDQQLVQDVLVGEGGALGEHAAVLQRLRVELPSADFACRKERLMGL